MFHLFEFEAFLIYICPYSDSMKAQLIFLNVRWQHQLVVMVVEFGRQVLLPALKQMEGTTMLQLANCLPAIVSKLAEARLSWSLVIC